MIQNTISLKRRGKNLFHLSCIWGSTLLAIIPLLCVFYFVAKQGFPALHKDFFLSLPAPVGQSGGGMANALVGSLLMIGLASCIGIPVGILCGIFLSEYSYGKLASCLKFSNDILASIPSIIIGIFIYQLVVVPMKGFSAWAGSMALAIIMLPIVVKTTEEVLKLIPTHVREAGLALGIPRWRVTFSIVLSGSLGAVTTGIMLAVARVAGESAPLLFTALNNQYWSHSLREPIASLPVQIYTYAISPFEEWHQQAWAGAMLLVFVVFSLNLLTRILMRSYTKRN